MGLRIAADLWQEICAYAKAHPSCTIVLRQSDGIVRAAEFTHVKRSKGLDGTDAVQAYPVTSVDVQEP